MPDVPKKRPAFIDSRLILGVLGGSHAYGTDTPESDLDYRGVCIPPAEYLLGLHEFESFHCEDRDEVVYSLKKLDNLQDLFDLQIADVRASKPPHKYSGLFALREGVLHELRGSEPLSFRVQG